MGPAHRLTGFSSMDTSNGLQALKLYGGAPPDGFLIDGHGLTAIATAPLDAGAPPDGFLIDGHTL